MDVHQRNFYNKMGRFSNLNLIPEGDFKVGEGIINFAQFSAAANEFVKSIEQREYLAQRAAGDET
jgi:hypothetical protein